MNFSENREIWKSISGYPNYEVSSFGRVRNATTGIILKQSLRQKYPSINLCKQGMVKGFRIHQLVASEFLEKVDGSNFVDHVDGDRTNNVVSNLRYCTSSQNSANRNQKGTSGLKGVSKERNGKFRSRIKKDGKHFHLGTFDTKEQAHDAYKKKAVELFGEFAKW